MSVLVLRLPPHADAAALGYPFVYSEDGIHIQRDGVAPLDALPPAKRWVAQIPCSEVSWHRIDLPKVAAKKLRSAVEGILEESILDDVEDMHFALAPGAKPGDTGVWVAVCNRQWLQSVLAPLSQKWGAAPSKLVPEIVPSQQRFAQVTTLERESPAHGMVSQDMLWITGPEAIFPYPLEQAQPLLQGRAIKVYAQPQDMQRAEAALRQPVVAFTRSDSLARALHQPWNMAQFDFGPKGKALGQLSGNVIGSFVQHLRHDERWRWLKWGLLGLVLVNIVGVNVYAWRLKAQVQAKRAKIVQVVQTTFPHISMVLDANAQMQAELARLQASRGVRSEQSLNAQLARMQATQPGLSLDRLRYENGTLLDNADSAPSPVGSVPAAGAGPSTALMQGTP